MSDDSSNPDNEPLLVRGALEGLVVPVFCVLAGTLALGMLAEALGLDFDGSSASSLLLASLLMAAPPLLLLLYVKAKNVPFKAFRLEPLNRRGAAQLLKAIGFYVLLSMALITLAQLLAPSLDLLEEQDLGLAQPTAPIELLLMFVLLVLMTPVAEELLFRGFMFRGFKASWGWLPAALASAFIFGLAHGQINVILDTAALGFASAWLVHGTKSLTPSILLHGLKNLVAFVLVFVLPLL